MPLHIQLNLLHRFPLYHMKLQRKGHECYVQSWLLDQFIKNLTSG